MTTPTLKIVVMASGGAPETLARAEAGRLASLYSASVSAIEPIGLSRAEAAHFVGVGATLFDDLVRDGRMPRPKRINSRTVWYRRDVETSFRTLLESEVGGKNPWVDDRKD